MIYDIYDMQYDTWHTTHDLCKVNIWHLRICISIFKRFILQNTQNAFAGTRIYHKLGAIRTKLLYLR